MTPPNSGNTLADSFRHRAPALSLIIIALAIPLTAELLVGVLQNGGIFSYTVDDAYIHLALAKRIQTGLYGINPGEFSSPASSILWPLLLAAVPSSIPGWDFLPLLINFASAIVIIAIFLRVLEIEDRGGWPITVCLAAALTLALNLTSLILSGMEHGLQVALTVVGLWGILELEKRDRFPTVAIVALILAPLIRYENFAITLPACIYLFSRGRPRTAALVALTVVGATLTFSAILVAHGLSPIPTSILGKTLSVRADVVLAREIPGDIFAGSAQAWVQAFSEAARMGILSGAVATLKTNLMSRQAWIVLLLTLPILVRVLFPRRGYDRRLATLALCATLLQLLGGRFDGRWFFGYEIYIVATVIFVNAAIYREEIWRVLLPSRPNHGPLWLRPAFAVMLTALVFHPYAKALLTIPSAIRFHYLLEMQMARFAADYWQRPIGVEPLGIAMWDNAYILDYGGLASPEVLRALSSTHPDAMWMDKLAKQHGINLVVTYWTPMVPPNWLFVGQLRWREPLNYPDAIGIYATSPGSVAEIRQALARFQGSLDEGTSLELCSLPSSGMKCATATSLELSPKTLDVGSAGT